MKSVTVGFDPRITGIRDGDLEAVEVLPLVVGVVAEPGQVDVDQAVATGARCGLRHLADDLPGDPEPHLGAGRGECGPEPVVRRLGSRSGSSGVRVRGPPGQSSRVPSMTITSAASAMSLQANPFP